MSTRLKRFIWIAGLAAVGVAAAVAWRSYGARREPAPLFETAGVDRGRIVAKVTATGTLSALVTVQVGSQVSGRIQAIYVDFNSRVEEGQVLARIDPRLFEAAREQAKANHLAARGNLTRARVQAAEAKRQYRRARQLLGRNVISQAEVDTAWANSRGADAAVAAARGALEQSRAALHQAEVNLGFTKIVSPTDGVVISRNVDVGQTVAASFQAPVLFVIAQDLRQMQVDTSVAEADVGKLTPGMEATFTVDAYPGEVFRGEVRQIRNAPQTVQNVVTYDAVVDVANEELKLRPGMTANVTFVHADRKNVLRVPNAALRYTPSPELLSRARGETVKRAGRKPPSGAPAPSSAKPTRPAAAPGERVVWVLRDRVPTQERVQVGVSDGTFTELTSESLAAGDKVVIDAAPGTGTRPPSRGFRFF